MGPRSAAQKLCIRPCHQDQAPCCKNLCHSGPCFAKYPGVAFPFSQIFARPVHANLPKLLQRLSQLMYEVLSSLTSSAAVNRSDRMIVGKLVAGGCMLHQGRSHGSEKPPRALLALLSGAIVGTFILACVTSCTGTLMWTDCRSTSKSCIKVFGNLVVCWLLQASNAGGCVPGESSTATCNYAQRIHLIACGVQPAPDNELHHVFDCPHLARICWQFESLQPIICLPSGPKVLDHCLGSILKSAHDTSQGLSS